MFAMVVAKEPVPGRVKTRLCPPCSPAQAAAIAEAALYDTFEAVVAAGADEIIVALDGRPGPWLPDGVRVVPQVDGALDHRLAAAWAETTGAGIQIGMDTPQVTSPALAQAMDDLADHDAVLGPATDGGWWLIGLREADERVFGGVPMSRADTGARQLAQLRSLGLCVALQPELTDVDHFTDAVDVASTVPHSRFAHAVAAVERGVREQAG